MIIQCEQCSTKFRLDDSKVTAKGVKVRCAKCKHVFSVRKEAADEESGKDFGALLDRTAGSPSTTPAAAPAAGFTATGPDEFPFQAPAEPSPAPEQAAPRHVPEESGFDFGFGSGEEPVQSTPPEPGAQDFSGSGEYEFGSFDFNDTPPVQSTAVGVVPEPEKSEEPPEAMPAAGEFQDDGFDFGNFDFGDGSGKDTPSGDESPRAEEAPVPRPETPAPDDGLDFGSDNLFGDAVAPPQPEEPEGSISFDFQDDFADSLEARDSDRPAGSENAPPADEPFSLGEIDFGDELTAVAVQQVNPDELKPGQDLLFAPLGGERGTPPSSAPAPEPDSAPEASPAAPATEEELPPLPISSRRKQGPLLTIISAVVGIAAAAAIGFYGYTTLKGTPGAAGQEAGRITIRAVNASYIKNAASGDLLVINGEAVNDYKKPRASIQVRGMIYGADGKVLASKSAYGGNPLTPEQLSTMPMEKIEAAMANQFGDSLANLEVAPGTAIPFVVVIPQPPAGGKEYGVEPAGSTVATSKQ